MRPTISKEEIIEQVFRVSVWPLHLWEDPEEPPRLDEDYTIGVDAMRQERNRLFESVRSWLDQHEEDWFEGKFSPSGYAREETAKTQQKDWMDKAKSLQRAFALWFHAGLGRPELLADFVYWSKMARYDVVEVTLLSMGLEPVDYFRDTFDPDKMKRRRPDPVDAYAQRRFELFRREFAISRNYGTVLLSDLVSWVRAIDLDAHPAFLRMIDTIEARLNRSNQKEAKLVASSVSDDEKPPEGREVASLAKLITAIAIDAYGYGPEDRRGPIPKEIQGIADRLGLSISQDTIRKYLQMGARYLPKDE